MRNNRAIRRYCRQVRAWLPCGQKQKRYITQKILADTYARFEEIALVTYPALVEHFGTPQAIAAAYIDSQDTAALLRSLRIRRRIMAMVAGALACILISWAATVTWAIVRHLKSSDGQGTIIITYEDNG